MTEGISTYNGIALPLCGESEIKQQSIAYDILTLTSTTSNTSDFFVIQDVNGTELFRIEDDASIFQSITTDAGTGCNIRTYRVLSADSTAQSYAAQFLLDEATNSVLVGGGRHATLYLRFMNNSSASSPTAKAFIHFDDNVTAAETLFTFGNAVTDAGYFVTTDQSASRGLVCYVNNVKYHILLGAAS